MSVERKKLKFGILGCNCGREDHDEDFECPELDLPPEYLNCPELGKDTKEAGSTLEGLFGGFGRRPKKNYNLDGFDSGFNAGFDGGFDGLGFALAAGPVVPEITPIIKDESQTAKEETTKPSSKTHDTGESEKDFDSKHNSTVQNDKKKPENENNKTNTENDTKMADKQRNSPRDGANPVQKSNNNSHANEVLQSANSGHRENSLNPTKNAGNQTLTSASSSEENTVVRKESAGRSNTFSMDTVRQTRSVSVTTSEPQSPVQTTLFQRKISNPDTGSTGMHKVRSGSDNHPGGAQRERPGKSGEQERTINGEQRNGKQTSGSVQSSAIESVTDNGKKASDSDDSPVPRRSRQLVHTLPAIDQFLSEHLSGDDESPPFRTMAAGQPPVKGSKGSYTTESVFGETPTTRQIRSSSSDRNRNKKQVDSPDMPQIGNALSRTGNQVMGNPEQLQPTCTSYSNGSVSGSNPSLNTPVLNHDANPSDYPNHNSIQNNYLLPSSGFISPVGNGYVSSSASSTGEQHPSNGGNYAAGNLQSLQGNLQTVQSVPQAHQGGHPGMQQPLQQGIRRNDVSAPNMVKQGRGISHEDLLALINNVNKMRSVRSNSADFTGQNGGMTGRPSELQSNYDPSSQGEPPRSAPEMLERPLSSDLLCSVGNDLALQSPLLTGTQVPGPYGSYVGPPASDRSQSPVEQRADQAHHHIQNALYTSAALLSHVFGTRWDPHMWSQLNQNPAKGLGLVNNTMPRGGARNSGSNNNSSGLQGVTSTSIVPNLGGPSRDNSHPSSGSGRSAKKGKQQTQLTREQAISGKVFLRKNNYFHEEDNSACKEYLANCEKYGLPADPGVLACFQAEGQDLYVTCEGLLAVASILCNPRNPSITRLHVMPRFENRTNQFVCLILEQILHQNRTLEVLDLYDIGISADGMEYLRSGLQWHPSVRRLLLAKNDLRAKGCKILIKICATMPMLEFVDVNFCEIGSHYVWVLETLAGKHPRKPTVSAVGNIDTEEIWSSITHGVGMLWSIIAGIYMTVRVRDNPSHHVMGCLIYSTCHVMLFTFSTLFHALYMKVRTSKVLQILDHCGIFLFIAASYTPIIQFSELELHKAVGILVTQWLLAIIGTVCFIIAFYWERFRKYYVFIEPTVCLLMGWMITLYYDETIGRMPSNVAFLILLGGILYSVGVPFLVFDYKMPFLHVIWHIFVLAASACHWFGILSFAEAAKNSYDAAHGLDTHQILAPHVAILERTLTDLKTISRGNALHRVPGITQGEL